MRAGRQEGSCPWRRGGDGSLSCSGGGSRQDFSAGMGNGSSFSETTHVWHSCANSPDEYTILVTWLEKNYRKSIIKMLK